MKRLLRFSSILAILALSLPALASAQAFGVSASANISASTSVRTPAPERAAERRASTTAAVEARQAGALATAKDRAGQEIDRRLAKLSQLSTRVSAMVRISAGDEASLSASIQSQIQALTTLKSTIAADSATTSLRADIASITKSYRIYALVLPQTALTAAADRVLSVATQMAALSAKLSERLTASAAVDVSALHASLSDYDAKVTDAKVQASAAAITVAALKPDNGDQSLEKSNLAALKAAREQVQTAQQDLVAARKDAALIVAALKKSQPSASTSASATTTVR